MVAGDTHPELKPSFRHALNITNSLLYLGEDSPRSHQELRQALENAFLIRYMPGSVSEQFEAAMALSGLDKKTVLTELEEVKIVVDSENSQLSIGHVTAPISTPTDLEKVPRPLFYENAAHTLVLQKLLSTHTAAKNNSFLLIGNQGVGKNKLVDQMLSLLQKEREYIQLHRDTTVQSLTVLPSLQDGKIVYEDSPLLRAAKNGTVLVIDVSLSARTGSTWLLSEQIIQF
jgi:von Willebrand factor A domain-containing protein 8